MNTPVIKTVHVVVGIIGCLVEQSKRYDVYKSDHQRISKDLELVSHSKVTNRLTAFEGIKALTDQIRSDSAL